MGTSSRLRERRVQSGLTQAELAARAGVSRQLVAAVEAGQNAPAVDAAVRLAVALGSSVEELFEPVGSDAVPALGGRIRDGSLVRVGRVGERLVAAELADHGTAGAAWAKADGVVEAGCVRLFPGAVPAGLVIAGCDPALGVAEAMLDGLGARGMLAVSAATGTALGALKAGRVHGAVVHGPDGSLPKPPVPVLRLQFARWEVGVGLPRSLDAGSLEALFEARTPVAQRDPGAASQQALARATTSLGVAAPPSPAIAAGHIDAARIAARLDCAALTTESAADAFGLRFIALEPHTVEVWLAKRWLDHPGAAAFGELLVSPAFTQRLARLRGYDLADCGTRR